jgi:uncharacterized protein involved in response to NO
MNKSRQEEIIGCLWLIAGLVAWNGGHTTISTLLLIKAAFDMVCSIVIAAIEINKGVP